MQRYKLCFILVCCLVENVAFPFPICSNSSVIDLLRRKTRLNQDFMSCFNITSTVSQHNSILPSANFGMFSKIMLEEKEPGDQVEFQSAYLR